MTDPVAEPRALRVGVITCSDSVARGTASDGSGPLAVDLLERLGHRVIRPVVVVADDPVRIGAAVRAALRAGAQVVVTTGGTGPGPRDVTPEALRALGLRELPGLGEAIRAAARERVPTADLSRSLGGVLDGALVLALPGSPGGVRDGLAAVGDLLAHAVAMASGAGHGDRREAHAAGEPIGRHAGRGGDAQADTGRGGDGDAGWDAQADADAARASGGAPGVADDLAPAVDGLAPAVDGLAPAADGLAPVADHLAPVAYGLAAPAERPLVRAEALREAEVAAEVARASAGAVVTFAGVVRDHDRGRRVVALHYEAHPDAGPVLRELLAEASAQPGVLAVAARHRVGDLAIGDLAFVAAVSAAHRAEAFAACGWLVDAVKARLPVWKHQRYADGTDEWVNSA